jgi:hypothetical protein
LKTEEVFSLKSYRAVDSESKKRRRKRRRSKMKMMLRKNTVKVIMKRRKIMKMTFNRKAKRKW